jgi:hypothetical protein
MARAGRPVPWGDRRERGLAGNGGHDAAPEHVFDGINGGGPGDRGGDCRLRRGQQGRRGSSAGPGIVAGVVRITGRVRITACVCVTPCAGHGAGHACGTGHARLAGRQVPAGPASIAAA